MAEAPPTQGLQMSAVPGDQERHLTCSQVEESGGRRIGGLVPGLMETLNPRADESHGGTQEVARRTAGAGDPAGGRLPA